MESLGSEHGEDDDDDDDDDDDESTKYTENPGFDNESRFADVSQQCDDQHTRYADDSQSDDLSTRYEEDGSRYDDGTTQHDEGYSTAYTSDTLRPHEDDSRLGDEPTRYADDSQYDDLSTRYEEDGSRYDDGTTLHDEDYSTVYTNDTVRRHEDDSRFVDEPTRYAGDSQYDDLPTRYEEDDSRFDDGTTQYDEDDSTAYTEDSSRWHGDAPPPRRPEHSQEPQVPSTDPLDDASDDPLAHPLENPSFARRPRATEPGAIAVVRRGREASDSEDEWDPTLPQDLEEPSPTILASSQIDLDAAIAPAMKNMREKPTKRLIFYATILTVVLAAVCTGIAVAVTSRAHSSDGSDIDSEPPMTCDFTDIDQPSPLWQCACEGEIKILSDELLSNYVELRKSFVTSVYEEFDYPIESCKPQNVALLWMATDMVEEKPLERMQNRYLLSVLYVSWKGLEWTKDQGWLTSAPECTWTGITCVGTVISAIELFDNNLQGSLVTELGFFTGLGKQQDYCNELNSGNCFLTLNILSSETLSLDLNLLVGSIPSEISSLTSLGMVYSCIGSSITHRTSHLAYLLMRFLLQRL